MRKCIFISGTAAVLLLSAPPLAAADAVAGREFQVVGTTLTKLSYAENHRDPEQLSVHFSDDSFDASTLEGSYRQRGRRIRLDVDGGSLEQWEALWAEDFASHLEAAGAVVDSVTCRTAKAKGKGRSRKGTLKLKTKYKFRCKASGDFGNRRAKIKLRFKGRGGEGSVSDYDEDGDGLVDAMEAQLGTDPLIPDTDGDGAEDGLEFSSGTDPLSDASFPDADDDQVSDPVDNCPSVSNTNQTNLDGDSFGDACDDDIDGDGVGNDADAFPSDPNEATDTDGDGVGGNADNCPSASNANQANLDGDSFGDACDDDIDGDGVPNSSDALPSDPSETLDADGDGTGDNADPDDDNDGTPDADDAFPFDAAEDTDSDADGVGDNADLCTGDDASGDSDENGICNDIDLSIQLPEADILVLTGSQQLSIEKPEAAVQGSLVVTLDGQDITSLLTESSEGVNEEVSIAEAGEHTFTATVALEGGGSSTYSVAFEAVELENPEECEILNNVHCLFPYPSDRFLGFNAEKGRRQLEFPDSALAFPGLIGPPPTGAQFLALDGFSPTVAILMHFPGGVDLIASGAPRVNGAAVFGEPTPPPYVGIRMPDETSLAADSPTVLIHAETGERVLHWLELDARAAGNPARQALIMRPGVSLVPGDRYIVAVRNLVDPGGAPIEAEAVFAAIRDGRDSSIPGYAEKKQHFEQDIFPVLQAAGIEPSALVLAWDFRTQTDYGLTHHALDMRDMSFEWLNAQLAEGVQTFTVDSIDAVPGACDDGEGTWRIVRGTYQVPLFLTEDPEADIRSVGFLNVDENDDPVQNGVTNPVFSISIPCASLEPEAPVVHPVVLGHGLFGVGDSMVTALVEGLGLAIDVLAGATNFRGLSSADLNFVIFDVVGTAGEGNKFEQFPALPDRLKQGQINTVLLARMMKNGVFNSDPAFQAPSGEGVFPGPSTEMFYYGISLGGIMGTWFAAMSPDVERLNIDVPAMNFGMLLQRSTQFGAFELLLAGIGLTDPLYTLLTLSLNQEVWVRSEPAGYVRHITSDPLPGTNAKKILLTVAWLDKQVSNQVTEILARSLGIPNLDSSIQQGFPGIPDVPGPVDSAMVIYDTGSYDIFNIFHYQIRGGGQLIPPLDNQIPSGICDPHAMRLEIPASLDQLAAFLRPGGQVENFCDGLCDATIPYERPGGAETSCDPLN